jgi:hypothetical protein
MRQVRKVWTKDSHVAVGGRCWDAVTEANAERESVNTDKHARRFALVKVGCHDE